MTQPPTHPLDKRLAIAVDAAHAAGAVIMQHYGNTHQVKTKSSAIDLVTAVDLEADQTIQKYLHQACPEDFIITEETYKEGTEFDLSGAWVVDPLDGTTNYAHSFPQFAVSIAYVQHNIPQVGVIFDPFKNELFTATQGQPAQLNGSPIHVSNTPSLEHALIATGFSYKRQDDTHLQQCFYYLEQFLKHSHGIRRAGAAALDLAYVAAGRLDGFFELSLSPWDVAAGMLIVQCAGGQVSNFQGHLLPLTQRRIDIVATNSQIHPEVQHITASQQPQPI